MLTIPLILFAKVPRLGKVKTRLTPELSFEQATEAAKVLLTETLRLTTQNWPGKVILALWPDAEDEFIQAQVRQFNVDFILQAEGDLGEKMHEAMESVGYPCAVMGCDVPHLMSSVLIQAHDWLSQGQNVLGPTYDGGYYLLGLQESRQSLFSNQLWGEMTVLETSLATAQKEKFSFNQLSVVNDIDTYADLTQASQTLKSLQSLIP